MPDSDEPLPAASEDEFEEISTEFIVPNEPAAPDPADDPFVAASRALVAEPAPVAKAAPRAPVAAARTAAREPGRPPVDPPRAQGTAPPPAEPPKAQVLPSPPEPAARRQGLPLLAALVFLGVGAGGGFFAGMLWERQGGGSKAQSTTALPVPTSGEPTGETAPGSAPEEPKRPATKATKGARPARKPSAPAAASAPVAKGKLKLTAPAEATVYLDGRRIGKGSMNVDLPVGVHRIEVRLGKAKVAERFWIEPNETWTYDVTPEK